jgi:mannose-6-phosphate isomerase-like protein (cupin superfamily)
MQEMAMDKVNLGEKLALITEHWRPKVVGALNGQEVKLAKFKGTFVWHHHDHEDELFLGVSGRFRVEFRDRAVEVGPGELIIVPRGTRLHAMSMRSKDLLDEIVATRTRKNPRFPDLVAEATRRREMARSLAARREALGYSQTVVAARMGTAASVVSKLEAGGDVKVSTLQRYCAAIGQAFPLKLVRSSSSQVISRS